MLWVWTTFSRSQPNRWWCELCVYTHVPYCYIRSLYRRQRRVCVCCVCLYMCAYVRASVCMWMYLCLCVYLCQWTWFETIATDSVAAEINGQRQAASASLPPPTRAAAAATGGKLNLLLVHTRIIHTKKILVRIFYIFLVYSTAKFMYASVYIVFIYFIRVSCHSMAEQVSVVACESVCARVNWSRLFVCLPRLSEYHLLFSQNACNCFGWSRIHFFSLLARGFSHSHSVLRMCTCASVCVSHTTYVHTCLLFNNFHGSTQLTLSLNNIKIMSNKSDTTEEGKKDRTNDRANEWKRKKARKEEWMCIM